MSIDDQPIIVRGAREHNLKSVDLVLPRNQFICFTGVSGSGKSSLAFDTLYAEGQRRYLESLSTYARQFVGQLPKPDVDYLSGLSPAISISQKSTGNNPRSTVGTITELHDFLRILFARVGTGFCPACGSEISSQTRDQMVERIMSLNPSITYLFLAPLIRGQKGEYKDLFDDLRRQGFNRARVDGTVYLLNEVPPLGRHLKHDIELVVDRIQISQSSRTRIAEAVDNGLRFGDGTLLLTAAPTQIIEESTRKPPRKNARTKQLTDEADATEQTAAQNLGPSGANDLDSKDMVFSASYACAKCGVSYPPPTPQLLSFNSPQGACTVCEGLGETYMFAEDLLIVDPTKSIRNGAIELIGKYSEMAKWLRRALTYYAKLVEYKLKLKTNLLTTPWNKLNREEKNALMYGLPDTSVAITGRSVGSNTFKGISHLLLQNYRDSKSPIITSRYERFMRKLPCIECNGTRLNGLARSVKLKTRAKSFRSNPWQAIVDCSRMPLDQCAEFFSDLVLNDTQLQIAGEALKEIRSRLQFLLDVGLSYLSLERTAPTLSGGESQRIRLASQIGAGLVGVLYVLDEPSIGLHPRDNEKLLGSLHRLKALGNTLIVVEHDEDTMRSADTIVDFGPGPGVRGGELLTIGNLTEIAKNERSITAGFLTQKRVIHRPGERRPGNGAKIKICGAKHNNLKNIDVEIPLGCFVAITGVSGSGKSSLITDILTPALRATLQRGEEVPGQHDRIEGAEHLDKIIDIDQSPIGRTPRSNPATYVKVFDEIRDFFAELPESKRRGFAPGTFSFNTEQGRCTACDGHGANRLDMEMLADLWIPCPACEGKRYNRATLQVEYKGKNIADCLDLDVQQAMEHFSEFPKIADKLKTLHDVGLDYLKLGQPSPTLSGGEAQRIKLSRELSKRATGRTLYILDEPTTGLHFYDIDLLLKVLQNLVDRGNTVVVVEHNLDLIQAADWVIDLGPEGGAGGGQILCQGTPEQVSEVTNSFTGVALKKYFEDHQQPSKTKRTKKAKATPAKKSAELSPASQDLHVIGARQHNLKNVELTIPRNQMTVFCGHSGSGKTSMAMDTLYAEGQRRFVESLSPYARQFVGQMPKPNVERVDGLSPSIAIEQRNISHTPRSTVGTVTEIYDYFRVLFARLGQMHCTRCDRPVSTQTSDQIIDRILGLEHALISQGQSTADTPSESSATTPKRKKKNTTTTAKTDAKQSQRALLLAPLTPNSNHSLAEYLDSLKLQGFVRVRINGKTYDIDSVPELQKKNRYVLQLVVDRFQLGNLDRKRLTDSVQTALTFGNGVVQLAIADENRSEVHWDEHTYSLQLACNQCGISFHPLSPHSFSFNSAFGWCTSCNGLGTQTGTDPAAFIDDSLSLEDGGLLLWPDLNEPISMAMLRALCREAAIPIDRPIASLSQSNKSVLYRGMPDREIVVYRSDLLDQPSKGKSNDLNTVYMSYRFHGVYPSLELAANSDMSTRFRLSRYLATVTCTECDGARVHREAASARFREHRISDIVSMPIRDLLNLCKAWTLDQTETKVAGELHREIVQRLQFLEDVGLEYLTLNRAANSLSGGESQRIRLASQLGSGLCGVTYVLDEPTIGLHARDNQRLVSAMHRLRDLGNTLLVVEHDRDVIASSDQLCDFGPGSGPLGGTVVAQGTPKQIAKNNSSVTGPFLSGRKEIESFGQQRITIGDDAPVDSNDLSDFVSGPSGWLTIRGARENTLRDIDVSIPLGCMTAITGPSGSGKSSLINGILYPALARIIHRADTQAGPHRAIEGIKHINKVLRVDQSPLGHSPSSNPATYTGVFDWIRQFYAKLPDSKARGFQSTHFSFNVDGGRCEKCEGLGQICIQMHFLPDVWIQCEACHGRRYSEEVLAVKYRGNSISDILRMSIGEVRDLMCELPKIHEMLSTLCDVGLDYLSLGQSAPTLSGGEAQRVKLAAELCRPATGRSLYLLDEPTTGLHFDDINKLMKVLQKLVSAGNSVVVIEHNLEVIQCADWIIDMGPEAGKEGGQMVYAGTPASLVQYVRHLSTHNTAPISKSNTRSRTKTNAGKGKAKQLASTNAHPTRLRSYTGEALAQLFQK